MRPRWNRGLPLCAALVLGWGLLAAEPAFGQRGRWWDDANVRRALGLSDAQVAELSRLFHAGLSERRRLHASIEEADARFETALAAGDETTAVAIIPRLAELRAAQNKARTVLLLRMSWVLSPAQMERFKALPRRRSR
jgi:hypothetical protein